MQGPQLIATLIAVIALLLAVGWMLLRGFVSDLKITRDVVARGQECWDEASDLALKTDKQFLLMEPRVSRLEGHDFHKLNGDLQTFSMRLGRVEADVAAMNTKVGEVHAMTHESNEILKEDRRRREKGDD